MRLRCLPKTFSGINRCIKWVAELTQTLFLTLLIVFLLIVLIVVGVITVLAVPGKAVGYLRRTAKSAHSLITMIVREESTVLTMPCKTAGYLRQIVELARAIPPVLKRFLGMIRYPRWAVAPAQKLFVTLLIAFILLLLVETIWEGSISSYLNLDYLLIAVITMGVIALLAKPGRVEGVQEVEGRHLGRRDIIMVVCTGLAGAAAMWYKTQEIGWLSYVISAVSGGLIVLLSMLIWRGDEEAEQEPARRAIEAEEVMEQAIREAEDSFKRAKREAKQAKHRAIREAEEAMERAIREAKEEVNEEGNSRSS